MIVRRCGVVFAFVLAGMATRSSSAAQPTDVPEPVEVAAVEQPLDAPIEAPIAAPIEQEARPTMLLWSDGTAPSDEGWAVRVRRVRDELAALGIDTVLFVPPAGTSADALVLEEMRAQGATIALWIAADRDRAELWRIEEHTDSDRLEHVAIITGEVAASDESATFAVRCAEVAHALSVEVAPTPIAPARPAAPPVVAPEPPPPSRWDLRVGASVGGAARSIGVLIGPVVGGGVRLGKQRRLGIDADLSVTALRGVVRSEAGEARVGWGIVRAHLVWWPLPRATVSPMFGIGGGTMLAWTRGRSASPFRGRADFTAVGLASTAFDVAVRVAARVRLRVGARVSVALPPIVIDTLEGRHRTALPLGEVVLAVEITDRVRATSRR